MQINYSISINFIQINQFTMATIRHTKIFICFDPNRTKPQRHLHVIQQQQPNPPPDPVSSSSLVPSSSFSSSTSSSASSSVSSLLPFISGSSSPYSWSGSTIITKDYANVLPNIVLDYENNSNRTINQYHHQSSLKNNHYHNNLHTISENESSHQILLRTDSGNSSLNTIDTISNNSSNYDSQPQVSTPGSTNDCTCCYSNNNSTRINTVTCPNDDYLNESDDEDYLTINVFVPETHSEVSVFCFLLNINCKSIHS